MGEVLGAEDVSETVIQEMAIIRYDSFGRRQILVELEPVQQDNEDVVRRTQGMNWIRPAKRLAIYLRDGMACAYCGLGVEDEVKLTLDHLTPYSKGGSNESKNLITCCLTCNSKRGNRSVPSFIAAVANYLEEVNFAQKATEITLRIRRNRNRKLDIDLAKELIARRGGFVNACRKGR